MTAEPRPTPDDVHLAEEILAADLVARVRAAELEIQAVLDRHGLALTITQPELRLAPGPRRLDDADPPADTL